MDCPQGGSVTADFKNAVEGQGPLCLPAWFCRYWLCDLGQVPFCEGTVTGASVSPAHFLKY